MFRLIAFEVYEGSEQDKRKGFNTAEDRVALKLKKVTVCHFKVDVAEVFKV